MNMQSRPSVLIVDDNRINIDIMVDILKDDYKLHVATNGHSALKAVSVLIPDIVLLDVVMPDMDGYEVCRKIKNNLRTKDIPIIFVSAKTEVEDEEKGLSLGAVDYISKPFKPAIVTARVKTHLTLYDKNKLLEWKIQERTCELNKTRQDLISRLCVAAEYRDNETGLHIHRMSNYCRLTASAYGLNEQTATLIMNAAPMHDVGKIGIPDYILRKRGKLSSEERKVMKTHVEIGHKIIGEHQCELLNTASILTLSHHEKWNGKGYPKGLQGEEIPLIGRIAAIADVFDALTSDRPYKKAWHVEDALDLIRKEKGEHFDPDVVDAFFKTLPSILEIKALYSD